MKIFDYLKILNFLRMEVKEAKKEIIMPTDSPTDTPVVKKGIKTTQFWLSALAAALGYIPTVLGLIPPPWGLICGTVIVVAYTILRTVAYHQKPDYMALLKLVQQYKDATEVKK